MRNKHFDISFFITQGSEEHLFLSVTPGFAHGPGIQRDGISNPRMTDPHSVPAVVDSRQLDSKEWKGVTLPATTDPFVQRAGTWTLYHHLKAFYQTHGKRWRILGVQSNGDLTMNYWHVAYLQSEEQDVGPLLCGLRTSGDPQEPIEQRTYRALVKWQPEAAHHRGKVYECLDIRFELLPGDRWLVKLAHQGDIDSIGNDFLTLESYNKNVHNIGPHLEFALAGKPIVERGIEIPFSNAIDRFEDVRHVFNLPTVAAEGHYHGHAVTGVTLGEYQLFKNPNERRAALSSPIIIDLDIDGHVTCEWDRVCETLCQRHYTEILESPTRRGQFRQYTSDKVEIYFPHNVYPFGVLGVRKSEDSRGEELVGLSSGGLSGRVGNTLEGITQIMFDFFGCTDAMVLDEGFDVFALSNLDENSKAKYTNKELLDKVCVFSKERLDLDAIEAQTRSTNYPLGSDMKDWPLNRRLAEELEDAFRAVGNVTYSDVVMVPPHRSQMRSVLIFATQEKS